jgi:Cu+-exporting ATPase
LSQQITAWIGDLPQEGEDCLREATDWQEVVGKGVQGVVCHKFVRIGSRQFMDDFLQEQCVADKGVYVQINNELRGFFQISNHYRTGMQRVVDYFRSVGRIFLLSGDNDREQAILQPIFGKESQLLFRQQPQDKLNFVQNLQAQDQRVLMIGDGLNDAGALQQSDAGIVITEDTNNFTPACDGILHAERFAKFPQLMQFSRRSIRLVYYAYGLAFVYNVVGLSFAVTGTLSPVIAAILMPASSITVVLFGLFSSNILARRMLNV